MLPLLIKSGEIGFERWRSDENGGIGMIDLNDTTIQTNLIQATVMALLYPLTGYDQQAGRNELCERSHTLTFNQRNNLAKRVIQLEARQTLLEADLALLRGQLQYENVNA